MDTELQKRFNEALELLWQQYRLAEASGAYGGCGFCVGMGQHAEHSADCEITKFLNENDPTGIFDPEE